VIGGGVEYAITNNITIKGEYLYADLGRSKVNNIASTTSPFFTGTAVSGKIDWNASIFRAGVNYKF
jgi:outer membrane immunogenic protein